MKITKTIYDYFYRLHISILRKRVMNRLLDDMTDYGLIDRILEDKKE